MIQNQAILDTFVMPDGQPIHIRPLVEADLPALEWDGEYAHFRTLYRQHYLNILSGSTLAWVAETAAGEVIGQIFILLYSQQAEIADGTHRAYLFSFRIKEKYRDHGLGGFMLEFVEQNLRQRGFSTVRLNVARANPLARHFYERHGYHMIGPDSGTWRYQDQFGHWQTQHEPAWRMLKNIR